MISSSASATVPSASAAELPGDRTVQQVPTDEVDRRPCGPAEIEWPAAGERGIVTEDRPVEVGVGHGAPGVLGAVGLEWQMGAGAEPAPGGSWSRSPNGRSVSPPSGFTATKAVKGQYGAAIDPAVETSATRRRRSLADSTVDVGSLAVGEAHAGSPAVASSAVRSTVTDAADRGGIDDGIEAGGGDVRAGEVGRVTTGVLVLNSQA